MDNKMKDNLKKELDEFVETINGRVSKINETESFEEFKNILDYQASFYFNVIELSKKVMSKISVRTKMYYERLNKILLDVVLETINNQKTNVNALIPLLVKQRNNSLADLININNLTSGANFNTIADDEIDDVVNNVDVEFVKNEKASNFVKNDDLNTHEIVISAKFNTSEGEHIQYVLDNESSLKQNIIHISFDNEGNIVNFSIRHSYDESFSNPFKYISLKVINKIEKEVKKTIKDNNTHEQILIEEQFDEAGLT